MLLPMDGWPHGDMASWAAIKSVNIAFLYLPLCVSKISNTITDVYASTTWHFCIRN